MKVPEALRACADTYEERNAIYGDSYKQLGWVMMALFPEGIALKSVADFNRFGCYFEMVNKMQRYGNTFHKGGHEDSTHDISVYSQMLQELDHEARTK